MQSDIALAGKLGVTGTPVMFLNGRRVTKLCESPVFWDTIAQNPTLSNESGMISLAQRGADQVPSYRQPEEDK